MQKPFNVVIVNCILALAFTLTACSGSNLSVRPLSDLTLPGLVKLASVTTLEQRIGLRRIDELVPYRNPNDGQMHVVFQARSTYYDATLDGQSVNPLTTNCLEGLAITSDSHWGICVAAHRQTLAIHDFTGHTSDHVVDVDTSSMDYPTNLGWAPSWAPDNRRLALISRLGGGCSIAIYQGTPPYNRLDLAAVLSLPQDVVNSPVGGPRCVAGGLRWSPDGAWLLFTTSPFVGYAALPLSSLNLATTAVHTPPITKEIDAAHLLPVDAGNYRALTWSRRPSVVTYSGNYGQTIEETNLVTGQHTRFLSQQVAEILKLAWTPDGKQLVFVLGVTTTELTPPIPQMYTYTPPNIESA
jgi:Tol biopolymer transport system component